MRRVQHRQPRRRSERVSTTRVVVVGGGAALLILALTLFSLRAPNGIVGVQYRTMYASVPDAGNLQPHNDVRAAGVRIGQVIDIRREGTRARVRFKLDPSAGGVRAGSTVAVRGRGLLGQRFLEVRPGKGPGILAEGSTLRGGADALTSGVPDVLDTFDADTRDGLGDMVGGLGVGLLGRGTGVNDALRGAPLAGRQLQQVVRTILARQGAAERLLPSVKSAAVAIDESREEIRGAIRAVPPGLAPLIAGGDDLRATLSAAPPALEAAQPALDAGTSLVRSADRLTRAVRRTLPAAPGGLRETTALLRESPAPLRRLTRMLGSATDAVPATLAATRALRPALAPLKQLSADLLDPVSVLGVYGCDVANIVDNWHSALGFGVLGGSSFGPLNNFRVTPVVGPESVGGFQPSTPPANADRDPYPTPCKYSPPGGTVYTFNPSPKAAAHGR